MGKDRKGNKKLDFSPQCFTVSFDVYPPIAMVRENALRLATSLAGHQDLTDIHMSDESWTFRRPQPKGHARGHIEVTIRDQETTIEHRHPTGNLERFEILVEQVIESLGSVLRPQAIWGSVVTLEYVVDLGSDARRLILGSLGMLGGEEGPGKLDVFERPCHFVGLRLGFPAFEYSAEEEDSTEAEPEEDEGNQGRTGQLTEKLVDGGEGNKSNAPEVPNAADWHATLTLQSLQDDPGSVMVEVYGRWIGSLDWEEVPATLGERLRIVDDFLKTKTRAFLEQFRSE